MTALAPALQAFFTDRLITQRDSSPQTIAAYRDTFTLLLRFAHEQTGKQLFGLDIDDLDAALIGAFLTHLERDRGNSARTRNARLGAIHSFYRFAALEHPEQLTPRHQQFARFGLALSTNDRQQAQRLAQQIEAQNPGDPELERIKRAFIDQDKRRRWVPRTH